MLLAVDLVLGIAAFAYFTVAVHGGRFVALRITTRFVVGRLRRFVEVAASRVALGRVTVLRDGITARVLRLRIRAVRIGRVAVTLLAGVQVRNFGMLFLFGVLAHDRGNLKVNR